MAECYVWRRPHRLLRAHIPQVSAQGRNKKKHDSTFEIDVEKLLPLASRQNRYMRLPEYPCVDFDLSIVFDEKITWADIYETATKVELVKDVRFIDEYRGPQAGEGKNPYLSEPGYAQTKAPLPLKKLKRSQNR